VTGWRERREKRKRQLEERSKAVAAYQALLHGERILSKGHAFVDGQSGGYTLTGIQRGRSTVGSGLVLATGAATRIDLESVRRFRMALDEHGVEQFRLDLPDRAPMSLVLIPT